MAFNETYRRQVALLLRTMPFIAEEASFALKGGTAINLFVRDLPRLSVDIDLTYLPLLPRARSLGAIDKAMQRIAARVQKAIKAAHVTSAAVEGAVTKLFVREASVQIKIEVTPVMRGCAYAAELRGVLTETDRALELLTAILPEVRALDDAETLSYLHATVSEKPHALAVPQVPAYLDAVLCDTPLTGGVEPKLGALHLRVLTVLGLRSASGMCCRSRRMGLSLG